MEEKERVALIRRGNEFFNDGRIDDAAKIFIATQYRDGLTRVGDLYYFDKKMPLIAYKYYKLAERKDRINDIFMRMMMALKSLVTTESGDKPAPQRMRVELPPLKVSPKLKIIAEEILRNNAEKKN
jgi:hypothetical protein